MLTGREIRRAAFAAEEAAIQRVAAKARANGTIGVPQHPEPSTVMQFVYQVELDATTSRTIR